MDEIQETVFETAQGKNTWTLSSTQKKWRNKFRKLAEMYPDEVEVVGDDEIGVCIRVPNGWVKLSPKKKMNYTEEQKVALAERMRRMLEEKNARREG